MPLMRIVKEARRVGPLTALSISAAAVNAVAVVAIARMLVPSDRGLITIMITGGGIIAVTSACGTNVYLRAKLPGSSTINLRGYAAASGALLLAVTIPGLVLASMLGAHTIDRTLGTAPYIIATTIFGIANFLWFQISEALNATGRIREFGWTNLLGSIALLFALALAAQLRPGDTTTVMYSYAASFFLRFGMGLYVTRSDFGDSPRGVRLFLTKGPRMLGYQLGEDLVYQLDKLLLGGLAGTRQVGVYGVAAAPAELLRIPVYSLSQYTMLDAARRSVTRSDVFRRALGWTALTAAVVPVGWLLAPALINLLYGPAYADAVELFRVLLVAQVLLVPHLICSRALVGSGATWSASATGIVGIAAITLLSIALVPTYGAVGAAFACVGAYSLLSASSCLLLRSRMT